MRAGAALTASAYLVPVIAVSCLLTVAGVALAWLDGSYGILAGYVPVLVVPWILWWGDSRRHPGPPPLGRRRQAGEEGCLGARSSPRTGPDRGDPEVLGQVARPCTAGVRCPAGIRSLRRPRPRPQGRYTLPGSGLPGASS
ncbi:hypothetical protein [Streptomyces sp. 2231.1]|uniref:hypothetical protein n=1 Tax=Streptomyces sp. 2231.1 TaxID=1855347 RepID=UPI000B8617FD|nr:hypothetical protein [Streptomyces sp. 2231.1]